MCHASIHSQCVFDTETIIPDESSIAVSFLVENAVKNNLATNNKVCKVQLKFEHEAVGDLEVYLISPSGKQIQLIGASGIAATTDGTVWDIDFVRCSTVASPDAGIADVWSNEELWGVFQNYNGSYYPYDACLEDLNVGTVNGTWTILINDAAQIDQGKLISASIEFCDMSGVSCSLCSPPKATPRNSALKLCAGISPTATELKYDVAPNQVGIQKYNIDYVIFGSQKYEGLSSKNPYKNLTAGNYNVCLISYSKADSTSLPIDPSLKTKDLFQNKLKQEGICGLVQNCISLTVLPVVDTLVLNREICVGDTLKERGLKLTAEGSYFVTATAGICDTIVNIKLNVVDLKSTISKSANLLTCTDNTITLNAQVAEQVNIAYKWTTKGGVLASDPNNKSVLLNAPGKYLVDMSYKSCKGQDSITIMSDISLPSFTLSTEKITCDNPKALVTFNSSNNVIKTEWSGKSFTQIGFNIEADSPGVYICKATDNKNCQVNQSIEVKQDIAKPRLAFDTHDLTCRRPVLDLAIKDSFNIKSAMWTNGPLSGNQSNLMENIVLPGSYIIEATGYNGCKTTAAFDIKDLKYSIDVAVNPDTITCLKKSVTLKPKTSKPNLTYAWRRGAFGPFMIKDFTTNVPGIYDLIVTDTALCTGTTAVEISIDTMQPSILVTDRSISCVLDTVILGIDNPNPNFKYLWSGPQFSSTKANPVVYSPGVYRVVVTDINQCTASRSINVVPDAQLPQIDFDVDSIRCDQLVVKISPRDTTNFDFKWVKNAYISNIFADTAIVYGPGYYYVEVKNRLNGCKREFGFEVVDLRKFPTITLAADTIGCIIDSTQILLTTNLPYNSIVWQGPNFSSNTEDPYTKKEGVYSYAITDGAGCIFKDSIKVVKDVRLPILNTTSATVTCNPKGKVIYVASNDVNSKYRWYDSSSTNLGDKDSLLVMTAATYSVEVTNSLGCKDIANVIVKPDTVAPKLVIDPYGYLNCIQRQLTLKVKSSEVLKSATWTGPSIVSQSGTNCKVNGKGDYLLTVIDTSDCKTELKANLQDSSRYIQLDLTANAITCDSQSSVSLTFDNNPKSIKWFGPKNITDNTTSFNTNLGGKYKVQIISVDECISLDSVDILFDTLRPTIQRVINDTITCFQPSIQIGIETNTPLEKVTWKHTTKDSTLLSVSNPNQYEVTIQGLNGCKTIQKISVVQDKKLPTYTLDGDTITCLNSKVDLQILSNETFDNVKWTTPNNSTLKGTKIKIQKAGVYKVDVQALNGCIKKDSIVISDDLTQPRLNLQDTFYLPCDFAPIKISVQSPDPLETYRWIGIDKPFVSTDSTPTVTELLSISLFAAGKNGCNAEDTTTIVFDTLSPAFRYITDTMRCVPTIVNLMALDTKDDRKVTWISPLNKVSIGDTLVSNEIGKFLLVVTGTNGCNDTSLVDVPIDTLYPDVNLVSKELFYCENTEVTIEGIIKSNRAYTYKWYTNDGQFVKSDFVDADVNKSGTYRLEVTDAQSQCVSSDSIALTYVAETNIDFDMNFKDPKCLDKDDGYIEALNVINAFGVPAYQINSKTFSAKNKFENLGEGKYRITVKDTLGCKKEKIIDLQKGFSFETLLPNDTLIDLGNSVTIDFITNPTLDKFTSISWFTASQVLCDTCRTLTVEPLEDTQVLLELIDNLGCVSTATMQIDVNNTPYVDVPNVFTPAIEGENAIYYIQNFSALDKILYMHIYDNWGNLLYNAENIEPGDKSQGWNGTFNGSLLNPGVYAVVLRYRFKDGREKTVYRDLTLLR